MRAEWAAFKARVSEHQILGNKTDTVVRLNTDGTAVRANYVVLTPTVPSLTDRRYTAPQRPDGGRVCRYDVRIVAVDSDGLMQLTEAVHTQLVGHRLVVAGRDCSPLSLLKGVEEGTTKYDRTARLFYVDETYEFLSLPI